jgi:hypothetical protein
MEIYTGIDRRPMNPGGTPMEIYMGIDRRPMDPGAHRQRSGGRPWGDSLSPFGEGTRLECGAGQQVARDSSGCYTKASRGRSEKHKVFFGNTGAKSCFGESVASCISHGPQMHVMETSNKTRTVWVGIYIFEPKSAEKIKTKQCLS